MSELRDKGTATRRAVLGDAHVDRAEAARTAFDAPFQDMITDAAWGHVWSSDTARPPHPLAAHARHPRRARPRGRACACTCARRRTPGASAEDVREALMHVAIYAGVPAANTAFRIAKEELGLG